MASSLSTVIGYASKYMEYIPLPGVPFASSFNSPVATSGTDPRHSSPVVDHGEDEKQPSRSISISSIQASQCNRLIRFGWQIISGYSTDDATPLSSPRTPSEASQSRCSSIERESEVSPVKTLGATLPPLRSYILAQLAALVKAPLEGIFVTIDPVDVYKLHAMVIGPNGTPFRGGFFHFELSYDQSFCRGSYVPKVRLRMPQIGGHPIHDAHHEFGFWSLATYDQYKWEESLFPVAQAATALDLSRVLLFLKFSMTRAVGKPSWAEYWRCETVKTAILSVINNPRSDSLPASLYDSAVEYFCKNWSNCYERLAQDIVARMAMTELAERLVAAHVALATRFVPVGSLAGSMDALESMYPTPQDEYFIHWHVGSIMKVTED